MAPTDDPGYARLLLLVGGIASDVKNILTRQDRQDDKISLIEKRINALEAFRWKAVGAGLAFSGMITIFVLVMKELTHG